MKKLNTVLTMLSLFTVLSFSPVARAEGGMEGGGMGKGENFEQAKSHFLGMLDMRMKHIQDTKSCVNSAKDAAALKSCHEKAREGHENIKEKGMAERKEMKEEFKEKRQAKMEDFKKKREEWKKNKPEMNKDAPAQ